MKIKIKILALAAALLTFAAVISACNTKVEFELSFISDDAVVATVNTNGEETIRMPADPVKDDFYFDGWYWDKGTWQKPFTANSLLDMPLSENMAVYAKWLPHNALTGTQARFHGFKQSGAITFTLDVPYSARIFAVSDVVEVHSKSSWILTRDIDANDVINSKTVELVPGDNTYYVLVTAEDGSLKLYVLVIHRLADDGKQQAPSGTTGRFELTYVLNGGVHDVRNPASYALGDTVYFYEPTKEGAIFDGWYESADYSGYAYNSGFGYSLSGNKTLYAKWSAPHSVYEAVISGNGGEFPSNANKIGDKTVVYRYSDPKTGKIELPENPVNGTHKFLGWFYSTGERFDANTVLTGDIRLNAMWDYGVTVPGYTAYDVSFNTSGGSAVASAKSDTETGLVARPSRDPVKPGYSFVDWYADTSGTVPFNFGGVITGNTVVYAKWSAVTYTVTYEDAGENNPNPATYTVESPTITLLAPAARTGYNFTGWTDDGVIPAGSTGNKTFTATWEIVTYAITYINAGGNNPNPATYTVESPAITLLDPAARAGYTFAGWNNGGVIPAGSTGPKTFTAGWSVVTYSITYINAGENNPNPVTYTVESSVITLLDPAARVGYDFTGWTDGGVIPAGSTGNKTFRTTWEVVTYTITYINAGANNPNPSTYTVESPELILLNPAPRAGYDFTGWNNGGVIPTGSTGHKNFTAGWSIVTYTITYEDAGANNPNPTAYTVNSPTITLLNPVPRAGYEFDGWTDGGIIPTGSTGNKMFTALWTATEYAINYDLNGGENNAGNPSKYTAESDTIIIAPPTRRGYDFVSWSGDNIVITKGSTGNRNYSAVWELHVYTVSYVLGGGENAATNPQTYTVEFDTVVLADPTRAGYDFTGWSDGGTILKGSTGDKIFTASWDSGEYTVTLDFKGGAGGTESVTAIYGANLPQAVAPTKANAVFAGYYDAEAGGKLYYNVRMEGVSIWDKPHGGILYARWLDVYSISYILGGGENAAGNPVRYTEETETITLLDPTRDGYEFDGWLEGGVIPQGSAGNKTFTALWTPNEYTVSFSKAQFTVSFDLNGVAGTPPPPQVITETNGLVYPNSPERSGDYIFAGWYGNSEGNGSAYDFAARVDGDITLFAKWVQHYGTGEIDILARNMYQTITLSQYLAFVAPVSGTLTFNTLSYENSSANYIYYVGLYTDVYNPFYGTINKNLVAGTLNMSSFGSLTEHSMSVTAGVLYYLRIYPYSAYGQIITFSLDFEGDEPYEGGTAGESSGTETVTYGESFNLPVPSREGYTFGGWYDEPGGNGTRYTDETGASVIAWNKTEDTELYAYWI
ncbi:MAG: InlB B-repeat-containing protein [Clostridiaceae bacterium]|nr:InlB B-repeat-containing protein [Clostridiaceae bacterium]